MGEESDREAGANLLPEDSDADGDESPADESEADAPQSGTDEDVPDKDVPDEETPDEESVEPAVSPDESPDGSSGDSPDDSDDSSDESDESPETDQAARAGGNLSRIKSDVAEAEREEQHEASDGEMQPYEPPDVSLDPDQLGPQEKPPVQDRDEPPGPPEAPEAPLAEDVARPDSIEEAAERTEPLEDEEMPLADHIEEMLKRLAVVIVIAGVVSLAVLPFAESAINFLWNSILPAGESTRPRLYAPLALLLTKLKVASLAGIVIALPVFVYETYQFMRPGLYPNERRYYLAAIPTSLVLAFVGISFAYFLILPVIFTYFLYYSEDVTTIAFALTKTFDLILLLMGYLAIVFQIPLFIMLAIMMGLTTRRWMVARRLYFWGAFLGISFLFSPDPTGMAPIMVAATMVALFEGTLFLLKWTGR